MPHVDYLFACLLHISNARPFFAVLDMNLGKLVWTSGGSEFSELLSPTVAARQAAPLLTDSVKIKTTDNVGDISFQVLPHEMGDTISELVRNSFNHQAGNVTINATVRDQHLEIHINDDGVGIEPDKLAHIRKVLGSGRYDPTLSTRTDGTGNGLLSAQAAVRRLVDGMLEISHGPGGKGAQVRLSAKLPGDPTLAK